jgi:hypothetical protein
MTGQMRLDKCDSSNEKTPPPLYLARPFARPFAQLVILCDSVIHTHFSIEIVRPYGITMQDRVKVNYNLSVAIAARTGCIHFNTVEFLHALHDIRMAMLNPSSIRSE